MLVICMYDAVNGYQIQRVFIFMRIRKSLCKILINKTFKIVGCVLKIETEESISCNIFFWIHTS